MAISFEERLRKYARLVIGAGVNVQEGQELIIGADVSEVAFVRLATEEAYAAGAKNVFAYYGDELSTLIRFARGSDEAISYSPQWFSDALADRLKDGAAFLRVYGANPSLLKEVTPEKVSASAKAQAQGSKKFAEVASGMLANTCIVGHSSPGWAQLLFPGGSKEAAVAKLWGAILACTHADEDDPIQAWNDHCAEIERRRDTLNGKGLTALHFRSSGTDLRIGLAEGHRFAGGRVKAKNGVICSPNIPTEEVFSMPHRDRVDGVVRSTKPLSLRGQLIDGIEVRFEGGKVVEMKASQGEAVLAGLLDTDDGARHLGEVALVPNSSRISQTNLLFLNTLYDENASCHIALGQAISENMTDVHSLDADQRKSRGMNTSLIHVDWMIGSGETDIDGIKSDGSSEPIMRAGEWAF